MKEGTFVVFEDSFNIQHIGIISKIREKEKFLKYGVIVLHCAEESNLNTCKISEDDIISVLDDCKNINEIEEKHPEFWI